MAIGAAPGSTVPTAAAITADRLIAAMTSARRVADVQRTTPLPEIQIQVRRPGGNLHRQGPHRPQRREHPPGGGTDAQLNSSAPRAATVCDMSGTKAEVQGQDAGGRPQ